MVIKWRPNVILIEKLVAVRVKYLESPLRPHSWRSSNADPRGHFDRFYPPCFQYAWIGGRFCSTMLFNALALISSHISTSTQMRTLQSQAKKSSTIKKAGQGYEPERGEHVKEFLKIHQLAAVGWEHLTDPLCKRVHLQHPSNQCAVYC